MPGTGPVAFGAALRPAAGDLVPAVVAGRPDGLRWITVVEGGRAGLRPDAPTAGDLVGPRRRYRQPQRYTVETLHAPERWCELVAAATAAIRAGEMEKVVLARRVDVTTDAPLDRWAVLERLRTTFPGCHIVGVGGFVAASPELLVAVSGDIVRTTRWPAPPPGRRPGQRPAAGGVAAGVTLPPRAPADHRHVHDTLLNWCSYVDYEAEPSVVAVANLQHLATRVEGRLSQPAPSVLELVAALHPTPAVAGRPRDRAVEWIAAHEGFDRGPYAGASGWVDGAGNGAWAVSVRCAEIEGATARVYAGNGIVADSDPETELRETRVKLQAMMNALVRP